MRELYAKFISKIESASNRERKNHFVLLALTSVTFSFICFSQPEAHAQTQTPPYPQQQLQQQQVQMRANAPASDSAQIEPISAYPAYYTIDEPAPTQTRSMSLGYAQTANNYFSFENMALQARDAAVSLLKWALHQKPVPPPTERYDRILHFGRWINDPNDQTCYNTRSRVLIRDSSGPVSFRQQNHCVVERGNWDEPYRGQQVKDSSEIQIDHMVPLKNAYLSGAWQWNFQTRCMYANYMGNNFHLISANGIENMRKGDRGPDKYIPPSNTYRCQYLENWLKIKLIWRLRMTQEEVAAIHGLIEQNHCNPASFKLSDSELKAQRNIIFTNTEMCPERRAPQQQQPH